MWVIVPHLYSLIWLTLFLIGLSLFVYFFYKNRDPKKPPGYSQSIWEGLFESFIKSIDELSGGKMKKANPYFFTLFMFLFLGSLVEVFGLVNVTGSIAVTFALASVTFVGIYIIGIFTSGLFVFIKHKYSNPIEIIGQITPLISLSFRMFGSIFAGMIIAAIIDVIVMSAGAGAGIMALLPFVNLVWTWAWMAVTIFFAALQAYVFTALTAIYWSQEIGDKKERKAAKKEKRLTKKYKKEINKNPTAVTTMGITSNSNITIREEVTTTNTEGETGG